MIDEVATAWNLENLAARRAARDAEIAREREWLKADRARMEKALRAKFAAQAAAAPKTPPPPATRGPGWAVLEHPRAPHALLEERALAIWKFCWHEADWPEGLRIKWGKLDDSLLGLLNVAEACTARQHGRVLGLYVVKEKLILLDEENQRGRPARDVVQTIVHELCHVQVRNTVHGEQFQAALRSAMSFYDGTPYAAPPPYMATASAPTPWMGSQFGPGRDPGLEYRG